MQTAPDAHTDSQTEAETEWHPMPNASGLATLLGPVLRRRRGDGWIYGMRIEPKHTNNAGIMHGGAIMALLDEAVGNTVLDATARRNVTVQMNTNFLSKGEVGALIEAECTITRVTGTMTFADARLHVGGETVATASLIFKKVAPKSYGGA